MTEALTALFQKYQSQGTGLQPADLEEMERNLATLAEFGVPEEDALKTLESGIRRRLGIDQAPPPPPRGETFTLAKITDLVDQGYYDLRVKVVKLFEPRHRKMHQTGILGDESGITRFVTWKNNGTEPTLVQGKCYTLAVVYASEYDGRISVNLTNAEPVEIDEEIVVPPSRGDALIGAVTRILSAGLVRRCCQPGCKKIVTVGPGGYLCPTHGMIEDPKLDIRARVVLDNGVDAAIVYLPAQVVEKLTWLTLAGAVDLANGVRVGGDFLVEEKIKQALFGRYLKVYASPMSGQFYANDAEVVRDFETIDNDAADGWELKEGPDWEPTECTRAFIGEMKQVREIVKDGDEKMSPTYAVMPNGSRAHRFFWCGVLVDVTKTGDSLVCNINDPTGTLRMKAHRQYQSGAYMALSKISAPALIAVTGKLNVYRPPDSEDVYVTLAPAEVAQIDKSTRFIWCEDALLDGNEDPTILVPVGKFIDEHGGKADE